MGLGIVLLFWAAVGAVVGTIAAATLRGLTTRITEGVPSGSRRRAIVMATVLPFACLAWAANVFVFQAVVNEGLLHRDLGLGDSWHAPLPNGYQILMIDVTDQGAVYNPETQPGSIVGERDDAVMGVRELQIAGSYILGAADSKAFAQMTTGNGEVDTYFILDTKAGKQQRFKNYEARREKASQLGAQLSLQPIYSVYSQNRFTGFDVFTLLLLLLPPLIGASWLLVWVLRLRRIRQHPALAV